MAKHEDLVSRVAIHVSPCPQQAILDALQHIVRDFCKQTKVWVHDVPTTKIQDGVLNYALEIPEHSAIIHIWGLEGRSGEYRESQDYFYSFPNQLKFNTKTPSTQQIKPVVSLIPSSTSTEFPDDISEYFGEYLISGAVAYLQKQPFRAWSQPNAFEVHQIHYQQGIQQAVQLRDDGLNRSKVKGRVKPQYI